MRIAAEASAAVAAGRYGVGRRWRMLEAARRGSATPRGRPIAHDRGGPGGHGRSGYHLPQRRRFGGPLRPGAPGPRALRRRGRLPRRAAEARQAFALCPQRPATAVRPAGQSAGLPFGVRSLRCGGHPQDERPAPAPQFQGVLQQAIEPKKDRTHFVPARAEWSPGPATPWRLAPLPGNSSADLSAACGANCYVELPAGGRNGPGRPTLRLYMV